ncbi:hypothetical cytosolic protein [Syntrophus aciditrophicus SB]|uniref:Hypothetical cytosolic protein n=1 Tax=Syntrophus aciditrophicus (strain SB) TaxID=56780 RepID=Q2LTA9_SYNAS|nr:hypothetical cytosolic protein [Syntrophus aciditrophicus SB]
MTEVRHRHFQQVKINNINKNPTCYTHGISFRVQDIAATTPMAFLFTNMPIKNSRKTGVKN